MPKLQNAILPMSLALAFALTACGGGSDKTSSKDGSAPKIDQTDPMKTSPVATANLSEGPDVCFRAVAKLLTAGTKVYEITSYFSVGSAIDSSTREPQGQMKTCTVDYQSPDDPRKLLSARMDVATGQFGAPNPVEITVMGNAAEFKLDDNLILLSNVNAAALTSVMDAQKARLGGVYTKYAWTGVRLSSPGGSSDKHTLRLDVTGRLASNDIKENGFASVSVDGKAITVDRLIP